MALLVIGDNDHPVTLAAHVVIGRAPTCTIRLDNKRVSAEHARIRWHEGRWEIRDLGSRNGTFLNGARLAHQHARALAAGDELLFGHRSVCCRLVDVSPPIAVARALDSGEIACASDALLALPSADEPSLCVLASSEGSWIAEAEGQAREVHDGEVVTVAGVAYMLHLPSGVPPTVEARNRAPGVRDIGLGLRVSRDEENVEVLLEGVEGQPVMEPRAHYYTLLLLARARLRDENGSALPEPARGWLTVDELCRMLAVDESRLTVDIYRIRRDLAARGIQDAAEVIERRRGSKQLRLGITRVRVSTIA